MPWADGTLAVGGTPVGQPRVRTGCSWAETRGRGCKGVGHCTAEARCTTGPSGAEPSRKVVARCTSGPSGAAAQSCTAVARCKSDGSACRRCSAVDGSECRPGTADSRGECCQSRGGCCRSWARLRRRVLVADRLVCRIRRSACTTGCRPAAFRKLKIIYMFLVLEGNYYLALGEVARMFYLNYLNRDNFKLSVYKNKK